MPHMFCAICGKDIDDNAPHFGMCFECYLKEHPLFELSKSFHIKVCFDCGKYSKKENWFNSASGDINEIINDALHRFLLNPVNKNESIEFKIILDENSFIYSSKDLLVSLEVKIIGWLKENQSILHEEDVTVKIDYELCKNCTNMRGGMYFLSILQIRVSNPIHFNIIDTIIDETYAYTEKIFQKDDRQYISKLVEHKNGVDLLLSTNELMNRIISYLKSKYYFEQKRTKKLVGRDTQKGRNLYRLKTLIRLLPFEKNDLIMINNDIYNVESISKNKVILRDQLDNKVVKNFSYFFNEKINIRLRVDDFEG
ncbi:MAG: NMD3-related protein [Promethearchaeota archaeon]